MLMISINTSLLLTCAYVTCSLRNMIEAKPVNKRKITERRGQLAPEEVQLLDRVKDSRKTIREQAEANRTEELQQHGRRLNLRFNVDLGGRRNNNTCLVILICAGVTAFILVSMRRMSLYAHH